MEALVKQSLPTQQFELLKLFERDISESVLIEIKGILIEYFAQKAKEITD